MSDFRKKARVFLRDAFGRTSRPSSRAQSHSPVPPPTPPSPPPIPSARTYANPPQPPSTLGTTGSVIHELLATARDGADLCLPLKAALVGVVKIWDICERTSQVKDEYFRANGKLAHLREIAIAYGKEKGLDEKLQKRLYEISSALNQLTAFAQEKENRGLVIRVLESNEDVATVKGLLENVSSLLEVFQFESIVTIELHLKEVLQRLALFEENRLAKELAKDQEKVMKTINTVLGDNFVSDAAHDEQPIQAGCMPGTREGILNKLILWVLTEPTAIFWLAGMAGTGKTSIAVTLSRMLQVEPAVMMGGGFFCSRSAGSIARTDVQRILPTLAGLLAGKSSEFARALAAELEEDPRVGHKPVGEQMGPLLRKPVAALSATNLPLVFVIDALDECHDQIELAQLIKDIADFESDAKIKIKVKFILTSRPEMHIRGTPIADSRFSSILQLHTISEAEVTSDIRLYIERTLEGCSPDATWYTTRDIEALLKLASGLFIFASTVLKFILAREGVKNRLERLRKSTATVSVGTAATATLDKIYVLIIGEASRPDQYDADELQEVKRVLACILTARSSLSVQALAELMAMQPADLRGSLERLHSVVYLPTNDNEPGLRTLHASFGDFLFDAGRAPQSMHIDAALGHNELAHGCLGRMAQSDLCFNISHSESSHKRISQPPQPDWIPFSLIYACIHWAHHIDASSDGPASEVGIAKHFRPKFLFWLEAMVVLGKVDRSSSLLRIAAQAVQSIDVSQFLRDARLFVDTAYPAIEMTPPHIYLSALPFAPKDSLIYLDFCHLCTNVICVETEGIDRHGGNLAMTLIGHEGKVNSIAYSPDGLHLASGSDDGSVRLWDTVTGRETISPLRSGDGNITVSSVAFSPAGKFIASGAVNGAIHLWDVCMDRRPMPPLLGHEGTVACVTFSPDGALIASAGADFLVRLWSVETGELLAAMEGHKGSVNTVAFNAKGDILSSSCDYGDVWRWDVFTRKQMDRSYSHPFCMAISMVFSPDGSSVALKIAAAREVRVWDAEFRSNIVPVISTDANAMTFSSDSLYIFMVGADGITSWNWRSGQKLSTISSDSGHIITRSPNGLYIASASDNCKIYVWDAKSSQDSAQTLHAHIGGVNAVALSIDGCTIASASKDGTVGLWNAQSGEEIVPPLLGHRGAVNSVVISPDSRLVASASEDDTIRIWDIKTGTPVGEPLHCHSVNLNTLVCSPDGMWLAITASDRTVRFWPMPTGAPSIEPPEPLLASQQLTSLTYAPDGKLIAAGDLYGDVWVWPTTRDKGEAYKLIGPLAQIRSTTFTPDGNFILCAVGTSVLAWNALTQDHTAVWELQSHSEVSTVHVSPTGRHIVSGTDDASICIWDVTTKTLLRTLYGHTATIKSLAMTSDSSLVSCSKDGTIRVWNLAEVTSPEMQLGRGSLSNLALLPRKDGWLVGPSDELLLWVPKDYISNLDIGGVTLIAKHKVVVTIPDGGTSDATSWTACWRV